MQEQVVLIRLQQCFFREDKMMQELSNTNFTLYTKWDSALIPKIPYMNSAQENNPIDNEVLPPRMRNLVFSLMRKKSVDTAAAVHAIMSHGSAAASIKHQVLCHHGKISPIAIYSMLVKESGKGKSPAHDEFVMRARQAEKNLEAIVNEQNRTSKISNKVLEIKSKAMTKMLRIKYENGQDTSNEESALEKLDADFKPWKKTRELVTQNPSLPYLMTSLIDNDGFGHAFFDEIVTFNAFPTQHTIGELNTIWSGNQTGRGRKNQPKSIIMRPRMTMTVLAQPEMLDLMDKKCNLHMRASGLWARFLIVMGDNMKITDPGAASNVDIDDFNEELQRYYDANITFTGDCTVVTFTEDAKLLMVAFIKEIEKQSGGLGKLSEIKDYTSKSGEHIARMAATINFVEYGESSRVIGVSTVIAAMNLFVWSCIGFYRVIELGRGPTEIETCAQKVLDYIKFKHRTSRVTRTELAKFGPSCVRIDSAKRNLVIKYLVDRGDVQVYTNGSGKIVTTSWA
jgi:hypothetical protein